MELFHELDNKSDFMRKLATQLGMSYTTIKTSWMYGSIPRDREPEVRELLEKTLKGDT